MHRIQFPVWAQTIPELSQLLDDGLGRGECLSATDHGPLLRCVTDYSQWADALCEVLFGLDVPYDRYLPSSLEQYRPSAPNPRRTFTLDAQGNPLIPLAHVRQAIKNSAQLVEPFPDLTIDTLAFSQIGLVAHDTVLSVRLAHPDDTPSIPDESAALLEINGKIAVAVEWSSIEEAWVIHGFVSEEPSPRYAYRFDTGAPVDLSSGHPRQTSHAPKSAAESDASSAQGALPPRSGASQGVAWASRQSDSRSGRPH